MAIARRAPSYPKAFYVDVCGPALCLLSTTRRLRQSWQGACFTAYRASDAATQDIGFVGGRDGIGYVDLGQLLAFAGASNVYVKSVFDQSGNGRDWTQPTPASQSPAAVSAGALQGYGGCLAPLFDGTNDFLANGTGIGLTAGTSPDFTAAYCVKAIGNPPNGFFLNIGGNATSGQVFTWGIFRTTKTNLEHAYAGVPSDVCTIADSTAAAHAYVEQHSLNANLNTDTMEQDGVALTPTTASQTFSLRANSGRWGGSVSGGGGIASSLNCLSNVLMLFNSVLSGDALFAARTVLAQHLRA